MINQTNFQPIDVFLATPHHKRFNLKEYLSPSKFIEELFVLHPYYLDLDNNISNQLKDKSVQLQLIRFLVGYSGTGKTTFMHWYCDNHKNERNYAFLDFTGSTPYTHKENKSAGYQNQLEFTLRKKAEEIYKANEFQFLEILRYMSSDVRFNSYFSSNFTEYLSTCLDQLDSNKLVAISKFINVLQYSELFLLLLLCYNKYPKLFIEISGGSYTDEIVEKLLLVIDNIDGINFEGYGKLIPEALIENYEFYLEIISSNKDFFDINREIDFFYCMRDTVHAVINPHDQDYFNVRNIDFKPITITTEIIEKRIDFCIKNNIFIDNNLNELFKFILNKKYKATKNSFLPLFNYHSRKIYKYLNAIAIENNIFLSSFKELEKNKCSIGSRGILYFLFLRYMERDDFIGSGLFLDEGILIEEDGVDAHINIPRILLTTLIDLCKYYIDDGSEKEHKREVSIYSLYEEYCQIFGNINKKEEIFFEIIAKMFLLYKDNWCHLITVKNKSIEDIHSFGSEINDLKYLKTTDDLFEKRAIKRKLDKIKISINSSGYIYIKDIVRHYEYFSFRENKKPLFASTDLKKSKDELVYEFIENISKTYEITKECLDSLKKFLSIERHKYFEYHSYCFKLFKKDDLLDESFITQEVYFDGDKEPGRLYINRIVDYHTEYIDRFRLYILNNNKIIDNYIKETGKSAKGIRSEINNTLIDFIEKYIQNYFIRNDTADMNLIKKLQLINIEKIKSESKNDKYELRINEGRD